MRPECPDDGACHHACPMEGPCWRVLACGPLSGVFPDNYWPGPLERAHRRQQTTNIERRNRAAAPGSGATDEQ